MKRKLSIIGAGGVGKTMLIDKLFPTQNILQYYRQAHTKLSLLPPLDLPTELSLEWKMRQFDLRDNEKRIWNYDVFFKNEGITISEINLYTEHEAKNEDKMINEITSSDFILLVLPIFLENSSLQSYISISSKLLNCINNQIPKLSILFNKKEFGSLISELRVEKKIKHIFNDKTIPYSTIKELHSNQINAFQAKPNEFMSLKEDIYKWMNSDFKKGLFKKSISFLEDAKLKRTIEIIDFMVLVYGPAKKEVNKYKPELILIKTQFNKLQSEKRINIISDSDYNLRFSRISNSLLEIINNIEYDAG